MNRIRQTLVLSIVLITLPVAAQEPLWWMPRGTGANLTEGGVQDGVALPICRGSYRGGVHPGRLVRDGCQIASGGEAPILRDYEVLTGTAEWRDSAEAGDAFLGGDEADGRGFHICRAYYANGTHPGKLIDGNCNIGWRDGERVLSFYQVLYAAVRTTGSSTPVKLYIKNGTTSPVEHFWINYSGNAISRGVIAPGQRIIQDTLATHPWIFVSNGRVVRFDTARSSPQFIGIHAYPTMADIEAGPIWSTIDAQTKCPAVCSRNESEWTKEWRTTVQGQMSVCQCKGFL